MRRTEKEIKDRAEIDAIIRSSQVVRIGLSDDGQPYIVPICFGYDGEALYVHCAKEGRKLDIIRKNNKVCFEFDIALGIIEAEQACGWGMKYKSVMGTGTAQIITDVNGIQHALKLLMAQYSDRTFTFPNEMLDRTAVVKIEIESITGKQAI
jgi:nitroimidazol reductase NimA-like FMN-containing flavoprotein (pyridoxamine 5'-phosphate oxidase superfamily)